ncbi:MAG TPA: class I SAM-dependent methyltransferase [Solirubrobacteraceae bacterium]|jgi:ubiquinone/menaquinone biosynthesis C-methylase UbiE
MPERALRGELLAQAFAHGQPSAALDLGTGTGSLAIELERRAPHARVVGADVDSGALARAQAKAGADSRVQWVKADATALPFADGSFSLITCSLVLHHLRRAEKLQALRECLRVLSPTGRLHIADWGRPQDPLMRIAFLSIRMLDGFDRTRAHAAGELPELIAASGFALPTPYRRMRTIWGALELISASPPTPAGTTGHASL